MTGVGNMTDIAITDTDTPLDGSETVELRLDREELYQLMLIAHERDITLNQLVEEILRQYIKEHKE
jgi:predicted HicB family RNase H-like nuclease